MKIMMPLFILLLMLISCNAKSEKEVIKVEAKKIRLWPGETESIPILSNGEFSITSSEPTVAQANVENNTIKVTATGIGRTSLILKDGIHDDLGISVSTVLNGLYTEEHNFKDYVPKFNVIADDKEVVEGITRDLTTEMSKFCNAHYGFEPDGRFFLGLQSAINNPYKGTFSWDGETLVLNYADKSETYSFQGVNNGPRPYVFSITLDLTDKYKELYPNSGIGNVSVTRFLSAIPPFGTEDDDMN